MLSDLEIYRAAQATIQEYGDGAGLHVLLHSSKIVTPQSLIGHPCERRPGGLLDYLRARRIADSLVLKPFKVGEENV